MSTGAQQCINGISPAVAPQAAVLLRLLQTVEADPRLRALEIKGSVARGTADRYSDLDTRLWIADDHYEAALADLPSMARSVGPTLDILFERPGSPFLFVQFVDGVQLELRAWRASEAEGRLRCGVVLFDRDGMLGDLYEPPPAWDEDLWTGWAWMRLFDLDKHLRRGSLWKALIKLEEARALLLRHHAKMSGLPDPEFGLTSILDHGGSLPDRLEESVAGLDAADLRRAGYACAELLARYDDRPFGDFVLARLARQD